MFARALPLALLCACAVDSDSNVPGTLDADSTVYEYVLGENPVTGEVNTGGAHAIVDFSQGRAAADSQNEASSLHPEITGSADVYDPTKTSGSTDWPVFASSWWPQSQNGVARRYTGGSSDLGVHSDVDNFSPVEKYDRVFNPGQATTVSEVSHYNYSQLLLIDDGQDPGDMHDHPAVTVVGPATAWELENHGLYQTFSHPDSWWGHCNGWASYATAEPLGAPERDIRVKKDGSGNLVECDSSDFDCTLFRMGDIEALMSEVYFSDTATFTGRRCNTRPDDIETDSDGRPVDVACRDINPGTFHKAVVKLLAVGADHLATNQAGRPPFIIDHNYDAEVWNFPLVEFTINEAQTVSESEATDLVGTPGSDYPWNSAAVEFVRIDLTYGMVSDSVSNSAMLTYAHDRNVPIHYVDLHYVLELDGSGTILGGEWIQGPGWSDENSKAAHPDFMWMPVDPKGYDEYSDDTGGSNDNPYISYDDVQELLRCANDSTTCSGSSSNPNPGGGNGGDDGDIGCGGAGCSGTLSGPTPFLMGFVGLFGLVLRRRRSHSWDRAL